MNQFVSDWSSNMMGDDFAPLGSEDDGLVELLWCNGHVVMQSQAPRKPPVPEKAAVQEHEAAPWFHYPGDDSLEKDISEIFGEIPADAGRACKEEEECGAAVTALRSGLMPPPPGPQEKAGLWGVVEATEAGESSLVTVGSRSICGSNHIKTLAAARARVVSDTAGDNALPPLGNGKVNAARSHHDASTKVTSLSMRSRPPCATSRRGVGGKRKQSDAAESPSEDVETEAAAVTTCEPAQKLTTAKRRRAAEVHNLSERRRRDRINEKMKALQELIPHCDKTDKASMLDEAIEYLKSLQLQVQMMRMGGRGMAAPAPAMFPAAASVHQYMQRMASMPRMPPFMAAQSSPVSQLPAASSMADTYARCLAVEHLQPPPSPMHYLQGKSFYQLGAAKNLQQNAAPPPPPAVPGGSLPAAAAPAFPPDNALDKNYGVKL